MIKFLFSKSKAKDAIANAFAIAIANANAIAIAVLSVLSVVSCSTPRMTTQLVHDIQRDTLYVSNYQYDSVYVFKDKITDRSRDTIYIREVETEYKYRILRDTVLKVQRDSIPYEVTKIVTKEIQRPMTTFDKLCRFCFWILIGILSVLSVKSVFKLKSKLRI